MTILLIRASEIASSGFNKDILEQKFLIFEKVLWDRKITLSSISQFILQYLQLSFILLVEQAIEGHPYLVS